MGQLLQSDFHCLCHRRGPRRQRLPWRHDHVTAVDAGDVQYDPSVAPNIYYAPRIALIRVAALPFSEVSARPTRGANTIELAKLLLGPISSAGCYRRWRAICHGNHLEQTW